MTSATNPEPTLTGFVRLAEMPEQAIEILRAAMRLFSRKGYAATSVREIVQEARVTNPMLYYYFGNKEGVFRQLIELLFGEMDARIREVLALEVGFPERIEALVRVHLDALANSPDSLRFVYSVLFGPPESRPEIDLVSLRLSIDLAIEKMFERAIDQGELVPHAHLEMGPEHMTFGLLGWVGQHMMFSLKSMEMFEDHDAARAHLLELTGPAAVRRLVGLFLCGAGHIEKERG